MTNKLAIVGIDFDSITLPCIFKVFESVVGDGVVRAQLYLTGQGDRYSVVEFKDISTAKEAYSFCDGIEVEQTGNVFNLSFVPDDAELDSLVEECENSREFTYNRRLRKKVTMDEDMVQLSDDQALLDIEIPEEYKTKAQEEDPQVSIDPEVIKENNGAIGVKEALDGNERADGLEGFQFNVRDERFTDLFEDDDFTLDASNKGFKLQKASKDIFNEKLKHYEQR